MATHVAEVADACAAVVSGRLREGPLADIEKRLRRQEELLTSIAGDLRGMTLKACAAGAKAAVPGDDSQRNASQGLAAQVHEEVRRLQVLSMSHAWPEEKLKEQHEAKVEDDADSFDMIGRTTATAQMSLNRLQTEAFFLSDRSHGGWLPTSWCEAALGFYEYVAGSEEPERSGRLASVVQSSEFNSLLAFVIVCNCFFSVLKANIDISEAVKLDHTAPHSSVTEGFEVAFIAFFTLECAAKLVVHRLHFFQNDDAAWNSFDLFLVCTALLELLSTFIGQDFINATFARSLRLLKVVRVTRLFRMLRVLRELRVIMKSMMSSCVALFWSIVMLFFMLTVFSLLILQALSLHMQSQAESLGSEVYTEDPEYESIMHHFGSVSGATLSFYMATTGGVNWSEIYDILWATHPFYGALLALYVAFFYFAVTNVFTGIIVENVERLSRKEEEDLLMEYRKSQHQLLAKVKHLYKKFDTDNSGTISWEEFSKLIDTPLVQAYFEDIQVNISDAELFYNVLLSMNEGSTEVDIDTFLEGCERLRGVASSMDMQSLLSQGRRMYRCQQEMNRSLERSERMCGVALALLTREALAEDVATAPTGTTGIASAAIKTLELSSQDYCDDFVVTATKEVQPLIESKSSARAWKLPPDFDRNPTLYAAGRALPPDAGN